jgi:FtsH-binding integral membrane protein
MKLLSSSKQNFPKLMAQKGHFLALVYASLAFQFAITFGVVAYLRAHQTLNKQIHKYFWIWFIVTIGLILLLTLRSLPTPVRFLILCTFSFFISLNCIAASAYVPESLIKAILVSTLGIFVTMTLLGIGLASMGIHLGFMTYILMCSLLGLLIALLVTIFIPVPSVVYKSFLAFGMALFSVFIAYDTNVILQKDYYGDFVSASIDLYLDAFNLFTQMLAFNEQ